MVSRERQAAQTWDGCGGDGQRAFDFHRDPTAAWIALAATESTGRDDRDRPCGETFGKLGTPFQRQDSFERTPTLRGESLNNSAAGYMMDFYSRQFWRFVDVQKLVGKLAQSAIEFPPIQAPTRVKPCCLQSQG